MKLKISTLLLTLSVMVSSLAFADEDDATWIAQCVADNQHEKASAVTVQKYCECMNDQMSDDEMQSITEWEKTHPKEHKECDAQAGWE